MIATLHFIEDDHAERMSVGAAQARWLRDQGYIQPTGGVETGPGTGINVYYSPGYTIHELNDIILDTPELRECDFCRFPDDLWAIKVARFVTSLGPIERPLYACGGCVHFVRTNDRPGLLAYAIDSQIRQAIAQGDELAEHVKQLNRRDIERAITPTLTEIAKGMFANRRGWPERV